MGGRKYIQGEYLFGQILSIVSHISKLTFFKANLPYWAGAKKYQKALNIQWFYIKIYFFVFDNYLHNMCIKYHELINWLWFSSPQDIFSGCPPKIWIFSVFSRIMLHLAITLKKHWCIYTVSKHSVQHLFLALGIGCRSQSGVSHSIKGSI